jgi:hypothetical protein
MKPFREFDMVFTGPNLPHLWRNDAEYFEKESLLSTHGIVIYFGEDFLGNSYAQKEEFLAIKNLFEKSYRGLEITGETNQKLRPMLRDLPHKRVLRACSCCSKFLEYLPNRKNAPQLPTSIIPTTTRSLKRTGCGMCTSL